MSHHVKTFLYVWLALVALLAATIGVALIGLGPVAPVFNIGIAIAKMVLVAWFFMHLRESTALTTLIAVAGLFWLLLMFGLGLNDWLTRQWMNPAPEGFQSSSTVSAASTNRHPLVIPASPGRSSSRDVHHPPQPDRPGQSSPQ